MSAASNPEEFYIKLKALLEDTKTFPTEYRYVFIVPSEESKIKEVSSVFDNMGAIIDTKQSSKGTYTAVKVTAQMKSANQIIEKYKEVSKIEGIKFSV